jgi:hypothetical protein
MRTKRIARRKNNQLTQAFFLAAQAIGMVCLSDADLLGSPQLGIGQLNTRNFAKLTNVIARNLL